VPGDVHPATSGDRELAIDNPAGRWPRRRWSLGAGVLRQLIGGWSIVTLGLDPDSAPPALTAQSLDFSVLGLVLRRRVAD
jgi:hypothetical protein